MENDWKDIPPYTERGSHRPAFTRVFEAAEEFSSSVQAGTWLCFDTYQIYRCWAARHELPVSSQYYWEKALRLQGFRVYSQDRHRLVSRP
jgi:hypothetical protein